ncbi:MAG: phosphoglucosamine mutase, partial [Actinomycetota bacterium]|nr:phosphoglucosamine mutase [Actinomycetota bacterium]
KLFGTDGVRGEANKSLTSEFALRLGRAAARVLGSEKSLVVVGRDTRISGKMLESALVAGFLSEGANVLLAEIMPTPAVSFLVGKLGATFGAVISASHNPYQDNGIKFFNSSGIKISDDTEREIEKQFEHLDGREPSRVGEAKELENAEQLYIEHLCSSANVDLSGLRIVLDCANGAAYRVCPDAFIRCGAMVETMGVSPDGKNINFQCGSTHPQKCAEMVCGSRADAGFALDGDGDRCICVDENGEIRDGDYILAIAARYLKERGILSPPLVVSTVMSNLGLRRALEEMGIELVQTSVGDRYVREEMERRGAILGGEQSGHIIFAQHETTGDGLLTALIVAGIMKESGRKLTELAGLMRKYPQVLLNVRSQSRRLCADMPSLRLAEDLEGKLGENGRILIRSSGTEMVERVMVEAPSHKEAHSIAMEIARAISVDIGGEIES